MSSPNRIQLAVYDLSMGMAAQMSLPLIGTHVEGIWHTGVVIFGYEYFFGGGIQKLRHGMFAQSHGMQPVRMIDMGESVKTEAEVDAFIRSIKHRFTPHTYDLLRHNCNNFSNELVIYCTGGSGSDASHGGREIPHYILHLANNVFSTPGGAMIRPLIENMQNNINRSGRSMDAFEGAYNHNTAAAAAPPPVPTPTPAPSAVMPTIDHQKRRENEQKYHMLLAHHNSSAAAVEGSSILQLTHPLLSNDIDAATLRMLTKKIANALTPSATTAQGNHDCAGASASAHADAVAIQQLVEYIIETHNNSTNDTAAATAAIAATTPTAAPDASAIYRIFLQVLTQHPKLQMAVLFVLRVVVVRFAPGVPFPAGSNSSNIALGQVSAVTRGSEREFHALLWDLVNRIDRYHTKSLTTGEATAASRTFSSDATYTMGLCVLANAIGATATAKATATATTTAMTASVGVGVFAMLQRTSSDATATSTATDGAPTPAPTGFATAAQLVDALMEVGVRATQYSGTAGTAAGAAKTVADIQLMGSAILFNLTMLCTRRGGRTSTVRNNNGSSCVVAMHPWIDDWSTTTQEAQVVAQEAHEVHSHVVQLLCQILEEIDTAHMPTETATRPVHAHIRTRKLSILVLLLRAHNGGRWSGCTRTPLCPPLSLLLHLIADLDYADKLKALAAKIKTAYINSNTTTSASAGAGTGASDPAHGGFCDEEVVLLHEIVAYLDSDAATATATA